MSSQKRRDTGRRDEFSDESPLKDYKDYRKKHPRIKQARTSKQNKDFSYKGKRTKSIIQQELISHIQNFQETYNAVELNMWDNKYYTLSEELRQFSIR